MQRIAAIIALSITITHSLIAQKPQPDPTLAKDSSVREVIVIIKTHFDIGYTHRVDEIVDHYRTGMIDQAMDIMDQSKRLPPEQQFAWTGPGWVMSKVLEDWDGQTPARRQRLDEYVKSGKFQFHALPFTLESDACEPEEMARGFIFASQLCRQFGMPLPRSGKKTDVPSHGGALATVLAQGGVKFMHIGCNWPSGYVRTPGLFWWEGPDGSRVLTFYSSNYGTARGIGWPEDWGADTLYCGLRFLPPADWPYPVWPAIIVTLDNTGPPTAQSGLSVSRPGVLVTAFGASPDGQGTLLRVWEHAGVSGELTVAIPGGFTSATPVNLRGEPIGQRRAIAAGQLVFPLHAYAPCSWVLQ